MPDGAGIYGILLNSFDVAVNGFGASQNDGNRHGQDIKMEDVVMDDMKLRVREVAAMYFDKCEDPKSEIQTILKGNILLITLFLFYVTLTTNTK